MILLAKGLLNAIEAERALQILMVIGASTDSSYTQMQREQLLVAL